MKHKGYRLMSFVDHSADLRKVEAFSATHNDYIGYCLARGSIDPISAEILFHLYPRHRILATLLCEHHLRYSEAILLDPKHIFLDKNLSVFQPKTARVRACDNTNRVLYFRGYTNWSGFNIFPSSYESLKNDIKRCTPSILKAWTTDFKDCTHIFRHIWATNQFQQNVDLSCIGAGLGHSDKDSIKNYIHTAIPEGLSIQI